MNNRICVISKENVMYPDKSSLFRPSISYPEYLFKDCISDKPNKVYEMVREVFRGLGFNASLYGTSEWNPLKEFVNPGDTVLIKPNMVLHINFNEYGSLDSLITHPSVVAAVVDYVLIALKGKGKIIIADAPLQECHFDVLIRDSGYEDLVLFYKSRGIDIQLIDLRNSATDVIDGVHRPQWEEKDNGVLVDLGTESSFEGCSEEHIKNLRVTNFDPRIIQEHHTRNKHEYLIAKEVLFADVVINVPKPKTHKKAGITAALKNLVGINASKEYLPHHTNGSKEEGGDAYFYKNSLLTSANELLDKKNIAIANKHYKEAEIIVQKHQELLEEGRKKTDERYWEGCWYGNDTIWRTISDLNKILFFSDKKGVIRNTVQRKYLIIGDMVISGQREGPLSPTAVKTGLIVGGEDPVSFDRTISSIMGFDYKAIPSINAPIRIKGENYFGIDNPCIISNRKEWNKSSLEDICLYSSLCFQPSKGWEYLLGNKEKGRLVENLESTGLPIIIFGGGLIGRDLALSLREIDPKINISLFYDNNKLLWNKEIVSGVICVPPKPIKEEYVCIVACKRVFEQAITKEAKQLGFRKIYNWIEDVN